MAIISPNVLAAQGPRNANLQTPRTHIPFAAGMTIADNTSAVSLQGAMQPIVPPSPAPTPVYGGAQTYTTFNDWYYRIHIIPTSISLGNLSGDTTRDVLVWNANFVSKPLQAFSLLNGDGITVDEPISPPATIGPLRSLNYVINVSSSGPSIIDAVLTWTIDGRDYVVPITGRRSVLFPFRPNWGDRLTETLSWTTTVTTAWSGKEQRQSIARYPRRRIDYNFHAKGEGARLLDSLLFGWMGRYYSLPIWHEESRLAVPAPASTTALVVDTTRMSIAVGSTVVVYRDEFSYEVGEVSNFGPQFIQLKGVLNRAWPAGSKVIPSLPGMPQAELQTTRVLPAINTSGISFLIDPSSPLLRMPDVAAPLQYLGTELYMDETDWAKNLDEPYASNRREIDNQIGPILVTRRGQYPTVGRSFRWVCRDRAYADNLRAFFARRRGRFSPVWMPSGTEDFVLAQPVDPVSPSIVVTKSQFGSLVWPSKLRRDIVIRMRDGTYFVRRIIDVAEGENVTILTLDQGFGQAFAPSAVRRISFLGFYRLANDSITFNWQTNYVATVETDFILTEPDQ